MKDKFAELMINSHDDAQAILDQEQGPEVNQMAIALFEPRAQKWLMRWQMDKTREMDTVPDTDTGRGSY